MTVYEILFWGNDSNGLIEPLYDEYIQADSPKEAVEALMQLDINLISYIPFLRGVPAGLYDFLALDQEGNEYYFSIY